MSVAGEQTKLQAMIVFIEGINRFNYDTVIQGKIKPYEVDGWKACLGGGYSLVKSKDQGRYQVLFVRNSGGAGIGDRR